MSHPTIGVSIGETPPFDVIIQKEDLDLSFDLLVRLRDWHLRMILLLRERQLIRDAARGLRIPTREEQVIIRQNESNRAADGLRAAALQELIAIKGEDE